MHQIPKDKLLSFDQDIISILSHEQIKNYDGKIENYYDNRLLALKAGHKIAELEIYLRNKLDFCLKELVGEDWIRHERSAKLIKPKKHTPLEKLSHSQILSSLMFGEIIDLIQEYGIKHYMFDLQNLDFKKYHWSNRNFGYIKGRKNKFSNISKVSIVLNLVRNIRNRAFHWENLQKIREVDGRIYPRLNHKENETTIGIMPNKILVFLDDLIEIIGNETMKAYKDIEVDYKKI